MRRLKSYIKAPFYKRSKSLLRIENNQVRVAFRLMISASIALTSASLAGAATNWSLYQSADPLTDQHVVTASTSYSEGWREKQVAVRCVGKKLEVFVHFGEFLSTDDVTIRYRFDKNSLVEENWATSAKGTAVFANESADIARLLMRGKRFIIEAVDFRGQPYRATFDLKGSSEKIASVLKECGKSYLGFDKNGQSVRREIALEMDRWGPKNILVKKKILKALEFYAGVLNSTIEPEFAVAVQFFYDDYASACRKGLVTSTSCDLYRWGWKDKNPKLVPSVSGVIYNSAPAQFKDEAGRLLINE